MKTIRKYLQGAIQELNQVTWPTKRQIIRISTIVVIFIFVAAVVLGFVDYLFTTFFNFILNFKK